MGEKIRLNKLISDSGYCSRREADQYIEQGRVQVNRVVRDIKGSMAQSTDRIEIDGELIRREVRRIYIALNKPAGITCTTDLSDQTNIVDFIGHKERIFHIGRLDKPSEGLIFMTNDGDIVNKILRAGNSHEKEYIVTLDKPITEEFLQQMRSGVWIERNVRTLPCTVTRDGNSSFRITLVQGLNRQIRRMCDSLGYNVRRLIRIRIMNITLEGLSNGEWRYFTPKEIEQLNSMIEESRSNRVSKTKTKTSPSHNSQQSTKEPDREKSHRRATSKKTTTKNTHKKSTTRELLKDDHRESRNNRSKSNPEKSDRPTSSPRGASTADRNPSAKTSSTIKQKSGRVDKTPNKNSGRSNSAQSPSKSSSRGSGSRYTEYRKSGTTRSKSTKK